MPTYQYACTECGNAFEAVQSFSDDALTDCPACNGRLRKVFSSVGIVFKGSGFYRNDSRDNGKPANVPAAASGSSDSGSSESASAGSSDSSSSTKADAAASASSPTTSGSSTPSTTPSTTSSSGPSSGGASNSS